MYNKVVCSFLNLKFWFLLVRENNRKYDRKYERKYNRKIRFLMKWEINYYLYFFVDVKKCVIHFLKESLRSAAPTLSHKLSKTLILTHARVVRNVKRRHTNFLDSRMRTFENVKFHKRHVCIASEIKLNFGYLFIAWNRIRLYEINLHDNGESVAGSVILLHEGTPCIAGLYWYLKVGPRARLRQRVTHFETNVHSYADRISRTSYVKSSTRCAIYICIYLFDLFTSVTVTRIYVLMYVWK